MLYNLIVAKSFLCGILSHPILWQQGSLPDSWPADCVSLGKLLRPSLSLVVSILLSLLIHPIRLLPLPTYQLRQPA